MTRSFLGPESMLTLAEMAVFIVILVLWAATAE